MGQYDRYIGDIEDYTDEEVYEYSIGEVIQARIDRLELAWQWSMTYRKNGETVGNNDAGAVNRMAGRGNKRGHRRGQLRMLAEELHLLVSVPEDDLSESGLEPWCVKPVQITGPKGEIKTYYELCRLYFKEVDTVLRTTATMTKAIPRYNRLVRNSAFPEKNWSRGVKQTYNRAMYRFERELRDWDELSIVLAHRQ